jgi:hypothetical protein
MIRENLVSGDKCFPQTANKCKDYSILRCLLSRRNGIYFQITFNTGVFWLTGTETLQLDFV